MIVDQFGPEDFAGVQQEMEAGALAHLVWAAEALGDRTRDFTH